MARTSSAKIVEWGEPPAPEPTGWEAVVIELDRNPGKWANVGDFSTATARKVIKDRFTDGYETRVLPVTGTPGRAIVWIRKVERGGDPEAVARLVAERQADAEAAERKPRTVKRGGVV